MQKIIKTSLMATALATSGFASTIGLESELELQGATLNYDTLAVDGGSITVTADSAIAADKAVSLFPGSQMTVSADKTLTNGGTININPTEASESYQDSIFFNGSVYYSYEDENPEIVYSKTPNLTEPSGQFYSLSSANGVEQMTLATTPSSITQVTKTNANLTGSITGSGTINMSAGAKINGGTATYHQNDTYKAATDGATYAEYDAIFENYLGLSNNPASYALVSNGDKGWQESWMGQLPTVKNSEGNDFSLEAVDTTSKTDAQADFNTYQIYPTVSVEDNSNQIWDVLIEPGSGGLMKFGSDLDVRVTSSGTVTRYMHNYDKTDGAPEVSNIKFEDDGNNNTMTLTTNNSNLKGTITLNVDTTVGVAGETTDVPMLILPTGTVTVGDDKTLTVNQSLIIPNGTTLTMSATSTLALGASTNLTVRGKVVLCGEQN